MVLVVLASGFLRLPADADVSLKVDGEVSVLSGASNTADDVSLLLKDLNHLHNRVLCAVVERGDEQRYVINGRQMVSNVADAFGES